MVTGAQLFVSGLTRVSHARELYWSSNRFKQIPVLVLVEIFPTNAPVELSFLLDLGQRCELSQKHELVLVQESTKERSSGDASSRSNSILQNRRPALSHPLM